MTNLTTICLSTELLTEVDNYRKNNMQNCSRSKLIQTAVTAYITPKIVNEKNSCVVDAPSLQATRAPTS